MRYQLRHAAGMYWLLDTWQEGMPYKAPLTMNETGADIWNMMIKGYDRDKIVNSLCRKYGADREIVERDIMQFRAQLAGFGIEETEAGKPEQGS